jgi:capsular polysaccharide biosynthesis protein
VKFELARIPEYASFAQTKSFLQRVVEAHRLGISSEQLSESLSVSSPKDTALIRIAVKSSSSAAAADRANAVAEELARTIPEREELLPVRATVAEDAFPATLPKRPLPTREIAEFAVIGATVGVALAITFSGRRERRRVDLSSESVREQRGGSYGTHAKA